MSGLVPNTPPPIQQGDVWTVAQWDNAWQQKLDTTGGTISGSLTVGGASITLPFGSTDTTINAAIAQLSTGTGGKIILPAGRVTCAAAITASIPAGVAITIEGMGVQASELYFSNATDGLNFTCHNSGNSWGKISLVGFTITRGPTSPTMANTGINIIGDPTVAQQAPGGVYRDLRIQGSAGQTSQWQNSMILNGISSCTVDSIYILGMNGTATDQGDALLTVTGPTNPHFATSVTIVNSILQGGSAGLLITQYVQGVFVTNSTIIGNYDGIRWIGSNSPNYFAEELAVANVSLNAVHRGIYTTMVNQTSITGATILRFNAGTPTGGYAGIEINQGGLCSVIGNNIIGANAAGDTAAIIISDCSTGPNVVSGNAITNLHAAPGIHLSGTTVGTTVVGNNINFATGGVVTDLNGNTIQSNTYANNQTAVVTNQPMVFTSTQQPTGDAARWFVGNDGSTESGSDAGNDFEIIAAHDNGSLKGAPIRIVRSTGMVNIDPITAGGGITFNPFSTNDNHVFLAGPAGSDRLLTYTTSGTGGGIRWFVGTNSTAESGANAGSDFIFLPTNDAGALLGIAMTIYRNTGEVVFQGRAGNDLHTGLNGIAGSNRLLDYQTGGVTRWYVGVNATAESGSNVGSDFVFLNRSDSGAAIDTPIRITRSTGLTTLTSLQITGNSGFNNTAPIAKPTVTGSKGGNVALASLITALAAYGLVTDSTT